jgi:polyisoprenoid-binding protein YceI
VLATQIQGEIVAVPEDLARSRVSLTFDAAGLEVDAKGEPEGDAPKVQEAMSGPKLLDVRRYPTITFVSTAVTGSAAGAGEYRLDVTGDVTLHGVTRTVTVPVSVRLAADSLEASGRFELKQTLFGLKPISAGAGTVKVKDAVRIDFTIAAAKQ